MDYNLYYKFDYVHIYPYAYNFTDFPFNTLILNTSKRYNSSHTQFYKNIFNFFCPPEQVLLVSYCDCWMSVICLCVGCLHLPCEHCRGYTFQPIIMIFCQNICFDVSILLKYVGYKTRSPGQSMENTCEYWKFVGQFALVSFELLLSMGHVRGQKLDHQVRK